MGTKGNNTLNTKQLKTWKEKADGGPLLQLKISPTISLDLQSSQRDETATAAKLTLYVCTPFHCHTSRRLIDCEVRPSP